MPNIIDIIDHKNDYGTQRFLVLDSMPKRVYTRYDDGCFIAHDDGFYDFLSGRAGRGDAFAGREFFIDLDDGTKFHCQGQVWASGHGGHVSEPTVSIGVSTIQELHKCYVFSSASVSVAKIQAWLDENTPSGNYYKYDPRNTIEWLDSVYTKGSRPICADRARVLRRRGVRIFRDENGQRSWCPRYESRRAKILAQQESKP